MCERSGRRRRHRRRPGLHHKARARLATGRRLYFADEQHGRPTRSHAPRRDRASTPTKALALAREVLAIEAGAIDALSARLGEAFVDAVELILTCRGRVVVCGIGKSGHVGRKLAATLASTGTPAFFVHADRGACTATSA